ncbi:aspartate aminotransferase family protein [Hylemonella gracilis]|uniref:Aspartate aminotransferase family protein n=1 Tax=Hylemonella gracilis TaxID=80880 RepID=A0A4P6UJI3_9BURK|nr:aspartate aminotransferase family protein [Hylemonella gracilis]QBK04235.1 aspartate aminotransferase family protein [Hylemonella gracilis]
MNAAAPLNNAAVRQLETELVLSSWSVQSQLNPLVIAGGAGCMLWDYEGNQFLDFSSQLINTNIGHQHPKVVKAIQDQAGLLCTLAPSNSTAVRGEAAKRILARAPKSGPRSFKKIFFTNAGADANENAMRMARLYTGRDKILSAYRSYHGNTGSAIVATGEARRVPNEYARGHVHFFNPYLYRSEFNATSEAEECERALRHLRRVIEAEGPASIAAILLESIPGTAGVLVPPQDYLKGVRALADEFGIQLILDEVMVGFGRTGAWLALDHFDVQPDLVVFAKGVNSGYVPVGGVMISDQISDFFQNRFYPGGLTYSGHPLAMASVIATLDAMAEEGMVENARRIGEDHLGPGVKALAARHPIIGEVRGKGVFWALEFVSDPVKRTPLPPARLAELKAAALRRGLLVFAVENRFHLAPPCIVDGEQVKQALSVLDEVLTEHGKI